MVEFTKIPLDFFNKIYYPIYKENLDYAKEHYTYKNFENNKSFIFGFLFDKNLISF